MMFKLKKVDEKYSDTCEQCASVQKPVYRLEGRSGNLDEAFCQKCLDELKRIMSKPEIITPTYAGAVRTVHARAVGSKPEIATTIHARDLTSIPKRLAQLIQKDMYYEYFRCDSQQSQRSLRFVGIYTDFELLKERLLLDSESGIVDLNGVTDITEENVNLIIYGYVRTIPPSSVAHLNPNLFNLER